MAEATDVWSRFGRVVAALTPDPRVDVKSERKGFGASALQTGGRIFAMVSSKGDFVLKLPRERVAALEGSGAGVRFEAGKGRPMKEWLAVDPQADLDWVSLAREALDFVATA